MKGFFITIVDVLGILVPGMLLLAGLCLFDPVGSVFPILKDFLGKNTTETGSTLAMVCMVLVLSYIAGFMLRLSSVRLMQQITFRKRLFLRSWPSLLETRMKPLLKLMTDAIDDADLCTALGSITSLLTKVVD